jgi:hypothetical protein
MVCRSMMAAWQVLVTALASSVAVYEGPACGCSRGKHHDAVSYTHLFIGRVVSPFVMLVTKAAVQLQQLSLSQCACCCC